jgi:zinc protease
MLKSLMLCMLLAATGAVHAGLAIQHWTLDNGARVYFVESRAIPVVDVNLDFDAGSRRDPAGKAGLASLTTHPNNEFKLAQKK